jgi:hypothetical protein
MNLTNMIKLKKIVKDFKSSNQMKQYGVFAWNGIDDPELVKNIKGELEIDPYVSLVCVMIRPNIQEGQNEKSSP